MLWSQGSTITRDRVCMERVPLHLVIIGRIGGLERRPCIGHLVRVSGRADSPSTESSEIGLV